LRRSLRFRFPAGLSDVLDLKTFWTAVSNSDQNLRIKTILLLIAFVPYFCFFTFYGRSCEQDNLRSISNAMGGFFLVDSAFFQK
jgi:hypothetical protein